jgi:hypothetical protein
VCILGYGVRAAVSNMSALENGLGNKSRTPSRERDVRENEQA